MPSTLFRVWAPGRVNLIGEHTDYSGGLVLPSAIEFGVTVDVRARSDRIELTSRLLGGAEPFAADGSGPAAAAPWARYAQGVAAELAALGRSPVGIVAEIESSLPAGAGLSSSAALEVGIGLALCAVAELELAPLELALACQRAELRAVAVPCGILDQAACVLGEEGFAFLLDCGTLEHRRVRVPAHAAFLVIDSGMERTLAGSGYAQRREELASAMELVGASRSSLLRAADLEGLEGLPLRRLRHVVTENARVFEFAAALERDDLPAAGRLMSESHASLRDDYEVSTPELDRIVERALASGAYGARLVGGGFGGAVLALVDAASAEELFPQALAVRPSPGARVQPASVESASGERRTASRSD